MKLALTKELLEQQTGWAELEVERGVRSRNWNCFTRPAIRVEAPTYQEFPGRPMTLMGEQVTSQISVRIFQERVRFNNSPPTWPVKGPTMTPRRASRPAIPGEFAYALFY
jgi:hypothetical protein